MCINSAQHTNPETTFHMRIVSSREKDGRTYDTPTAYEVAALIPCDFNLEMDKRDIVLEEKQTGWLKRISEIHPSYLALQYPLIFTYGEDGFRLGIKKRPTDATAKLKRKNISMRQWYAFQIQERDGGSHTLLHSKRLFQQFLVDAFTTIESNRLCYLRMNQKSLRSDSFDSIQQSENYGKIDMHDQGSRFLLPVTFVGGPRYMKNMYLDAMAICKYFGFPDLFITFTCNPKWPETTRYLQPRKLSLDDRSDILCRIFKCKLDSLMDDLTEKELLGKTVACEFYYMDNTLTFKISSIHLSSIINNYQYSKMEREKYEKGDKEAIHEDDDFGDVSTKANQTSQYQDWMEVNSKNKEKTMINHENNSNTS
ncbi:unnamed protein product [Brassica oleracea]